MFEPTPTAQAVRAALTVLALGSGVSTALAQSTPEAASIRLKPGASLQQQLPQSVTNQLPVFISSDQMTSEMDGTTVLEGAAQLRQHDAVLRADRIEHNRVTGLSDPGFS